MSDKQLAAAFFIVITALVIAVVDAWNDSRKIAGGGGSSVITLYWYDASYIPAATQHKEDMIRFLGARPSLLNGVPLEGTGDLYTLSELRSSGRIIMVVYNTKARLLEKGEHMSRVEILEGLHKGTRAWIGNAMYFGAGQPKTEEQRIPTFEEMERQKRQRH